MEVMKFGGAALKSAASIQNAGTIILSAQKPLLVVVSAMDKTTNHLEKLAFYAERQDEESVHKQLDFIIQFHESIKKELFPKSHPLLEKDLSAMYEGIRKTVTGILMLEDFPASAYDKIVSYGELLSSYFLAAYLATIGLNPTWMDARKLILTGSQFRKAEVLWTETQENIRTQVLPIIQNNGLIITQGFIAGSSNGKTVTLGREGSDYSAAIFAACLGANALTVWKDVPGIMNADPKSDQKAEVFSGLSYYTAVEMTFYGATVIHPKTIKPLENAGIPLKVRSFLSPESLGTQIDRRHDEPQLTVHMVKKNQCLIRLRTRNYSFMDHIALGEVFQRIASDGLQVNLVQSSAVELLLCCDAEENILPGFISGLDELFDAEIIRNLQLNTHLRYRSSDIPLEEEVLLVQRTDKDLHWVGRMSN